MPIIIKKKFKDFESEIYLEIVPELDYKPKSLVFLDITHEDKEELISIGLDKEDIEQLILELSHIKNFM
jgi:hypothetical protein